MKIADKLSKIDDSFTVNMHDNGFVFEISGRNEDDDWASAKILCTDTEQLHELISEATSFPRS